MRQLGNSQIEKQPRHVAELLCMWRLAAAIRHGISSFTSS
jgi:hypothetical protein